jgi:integrase
MARGIHRLTALSIKRNKPGRIADGGGLYLQIGRQGTKAWLFRFMLNGRAREMGLGSCHTLSLAEARDAALECRKQLLAGLDPIEARKANRRAQLLQAAKAMTLRQCATAYIDAHKDGWRNEKHSEQWTATLETYAYPKIGDLSVAAVDTGLVMSVIEPIWRTKTETASRVRGRIENILDWATTHQYRQGENPARWKGHLENLLPERSRVAKVEHHAALPFREIGDFMAQLREQEGFAAKTLQFCILTATRSGETRGARWVEIDLTERIWTIPGDRTKTGKEHRVPLSSAALEIIADMQKYRHSEGEFLFSPEGDGHRKLSENAMLALLRRMERSDITPHGFRSTFRDWAAETTNFPREVAEMALGHAIGDKVEAAYRRGDLFKKRIALMEQWAKRCNTPSGGNVLKMERKSAE